MIMGMSDAEKGQINVILAGYKKTTFGRGN
jgi:hypothetical protein